KLHKIHEVQLAKLTDPGERQAMYGRLAELAETKLRDGVRAFRWWGEAFAEEPRSERAGEELLRLAETTSSWNDLVAIYSDVLDRRMEADVQRGTLLRLARVYDRELRDGTLAEETYLRALALDPKDPGALEALDRIYEAAGMYPDLADILRRRVDIAVSTEDLIGLYFRLGRVETEVLDNPDAAIACYDKILAEDSRNRHALEALEHIYFRRGEWRKLHDVYEKMVDVAVGDAEMAEVYARMARLSSEALDDDERAIELWLRVIDLRGEEPIRLDAPADLLERREAWRELVDVLERQVLLHAEARQRTAVYKRLGKVWAEKLGRERNALEAWLRAFEIDPHDIETLRALAHLYRATQSWEDLSLTLRRLIEAGPISGDGAEGEMS